MNHKTLILTTLLVVAAGATFLVGIGIQRYGSIGVPVALTAIPFVLGLLLLPLAIETRGKPLPV